MSNLSIKPITGTLFKRRKGKYIPATSKEEGVFYYQFNPRVDKRVKNVTICLKTTDVFEARLKADALAWKAYQFADEYYLKSKMAPELIGETIPDKEVQESIRTQKAGKIIHNKLSLEDVWPIFVKKYEVKYKSEVSYKQIWDRFLKFAKVKKIKYMEDVTREICEEYQRDVYAHKTTAKRDVLHLHRMWSTLFPDSPINPWNTGLHLKARTLDKACNYRCITAEEARRVRDEFKKMGESDSAYHAMYEDLSKAIYFSWWYGMRIGSLAVIRREDFQDDFFFHTPPKTEGAKPHPLEIPIVPEVAEVLKTLPKKGYLFPSVQHVYETCPGHLSNRIKEIFIKAGVRDSKQQGRATWHSLRASFITQMDEHKIPTGITDSITGHAAKTMHNRYSHASVKAKADNILDAIEPLNQKKKEDPEDGVALPVQETQEVPVETEPVVDAAS